MAQLMQGNAGKERQGEDERRDPSKCHRLNSTQAIDDAAGLLVDGREAPGNKKHNKNYCPVQPDRYAHDPS
jgi:hypothetical protein